MDEARASTADLATSATLVEIKRDANEDAHVRPAHFLISSPSPIKRNLLAILRSPAQHCAATGAYAARCEITVHSGWGETSDISIRKIVLAWATMRWFSIMLYNQNASSGLRSRNHLSTLVIFGETKRCLGLFHEQYSREKKMQF